MYLPFPRQQHRFHQQRYPGMTLPRTPPQWLVARKSQTFSQERLVDDTKTGSMRRLRAIVAHLGSVGTDGWNTGYGPPLRLPVAVVGVTPTRRSHREAPAGRRLGQYVFECRR
jgi:hypothetical protein